MVDVTGYGQTNAALAAPDESWFTFSPFGGKACTHIILTGPCVSPRSSLLVRDVHWTGAEAKEMTTLLIVLLVFFVLGGGGWGYSRWRR